MTVSSPQNAGRGRHLRQVQVLARRLIVALLALCPVTMARADTGLGGLDLSAYRGKVVYLDFWASWCAPCKASFPYMEGLQIDHGKQGLVVIAVNLDHDRAKADAFLAAEDARHIQVMYDSKGQIAKSFKVKAMPTSLLIGRDGTVRFVHSGFREGETGLYDAHLQELLHEK